MCLVSAKQGASCLLLICLANRTRSSMMPSSRVGFPTPVATTSMPRMKLFQHRHAANIRPGARIHRACGGGGRLRSSSTVRRTSVSWCRWTTPSAATVCRPSHSPNSFLPVLKGSGRTRSCGSSSQLQLKGYSQTPFSRFADGLAVTHSSVREQLAGEQFFASARRPAKSVRNI
jgi:hypothetical protein